MTEKENLKFFTSFILYGDNSKNNIGTEVFRDGECKLDLGKRNNHASCETVACGQRKWFCCTRDKTLSIALRRVLMTKEGGK